MNGGLVGLVWFRDVEQAGGSYILDLQEGLFNISETLKPKATENVDEGFWRIIFQAPLQFPILPCRVKIQMLLEISVRWVNLCKLIELKVIYNVYSRKDPSTEEFMTNLDSKPIGNSAFCNDELEIL